VLVPDCLAEQAACRLRRWLRPAAINVSVLHAHGAALFSIHPKCPCFGQIGRISQWNS
jgi:hypothetical protein